MHKPDLKQLPQEFVIFKVRHPGIVQDIVSVIRVLQQPGQLRSSFSGFHCTPPLTARQGCRALRV